MANFDTIKTAIDANINTNGNQAITGAVMNSILKQMVDSTDTELNELERALSETIGANKIETDTKLTELEKKTIRQSGVVNKDFVHTSGRELLFTFDLLKDEQLTISVTTKNIPTTNGYIEIYTKEAVIGREEGRLLQSKILSTGSTEIKNISFTPKEDYKDAKFVLYFDQNTEGNISVILGGKTLHNAYSKAESNANHISIIENNSTVIIAELFEMGLYRSDTNQFVLGSGDWWTSPFIYVKNIDIISLVGSMKRYILTAFNSQKQIIFVSDTQSSTSVFNNYEYIKDADYIRISVSGTSGTIINIDNVKEFNPIISKPKSYNYDISGWVFGKPNESGIIDNDITWMTSNSMIFLNHDKLVFHAPNADWTWRIMITYYDKNKQFIKRGRIYTSYNSHINQSAIIDDNHNNAYFALVSVGRKPFDTYTQSEEFSKTTGFVGVNQSYLPNKVQGCIEELSSLDTGILAYYKGIPNSGTTIIKSDLVLEPNVPYVLTWSVSNYPTEHNAYLLVEDTSSIKEISIRYNSPRRIYNVKETFVVSSKKQAVRIRLLSTDILGEVIIGLYKTDNVSLGSLNVRLGDIESMFGEGLLQYSNKEDVENVLNNIKRPSDSYNGIDGPIKHLNLCWFSDIHHSEDNLVRIMNFYKRYSNYFDDILFTGDAVMAVTSDDFSFWTKHDFAKDILFAIGNHEAYVSSGGNWILNNNKKEVFDKFMYGRSNWNVTFASNAESQGLSYYYKDYTDAKIRMIVLDAMYWDDEQNSWLAAILNEAKNNDYNVICVSHFSPSQIEMNEDTAWTDSFFIRNSTRKTIDVSSSSTTFGTDNKAATSVDDFISNGGKFITWICGHLHADVLGTLVAHPNQTIIGITSAMTDTRFQSGARLTGTISQDAINIISFDAFQKTFSVYRIGCNMDCLLRKKEILVYSWDKEDMRILRD